MTEKVEIELLGNHDHNDRQYAAGNKIKVWPDQAEWLVGKGIAKLAARDTVPAKAAPAIPANN